MLNIPVISNEKNYWLVRTNGGRYYSDYKFGGFIAINWNEISLEDIRELNDKDLNKKIKEKYPAKKEPGRATSQLKIFHSQIKKGDAVVITSYGSSKFLIGEVLEDEAFTVYVDEEKIKENPKICAYEKRKNVKWIKEVHKWDVDRPMFKLLQHARNTINEANAYAEIIESLIHDFFVKDGNAYFSLKVKRESNIPANDFFKMGAEILDLVNEFGEYKGLSSIHSNDIITKVNVNSEGKAKFIGPAIAVSVAVSIVVVCLTGGGGSFPLPESMGGGEVNFETNGLFREGIIKEVSDFLDAKQQREHKELILNKYLEQLEIDAPDEFKELIEVVENQNNDTVSE